MLKAAYNKLTGKAPRLGDPENIESEIGPADLESAQPEEKESEVEVVRLVKKRFKSAREAKQKHEEEWLLDMAFERGNQWVEWRDGQLDSLVDPNDPYRSYMKCNLILPMTSKIKARATMTKPDASVQPLTDSPLDLDAASEARDGLEHYDLLLNMPGLTNEWVDSVLSSSTSFMKCVWDPKKMVLVPTVDPVTSETGPAKMKPLGDIERVVVPPTEAFPDPHAKRWNEVSWFIHAKERTLTYVQEKFPEKGYGVEGGAGGADSNYIQARIDGIMGEQETRFNNEGDRVVTLLEMWELPSARYPKGRVCWVAGDVLLAAVDWPYRKHDTFPFVPLTYRMKGGSLWSLNAVHDLVPLQRQYNNILSRINDHINTYKNTILTPEGFEGGVDAFQSERSFNRLTYKAGHEPHYFPSPPLPHEWLEVLGLIRQQMEDVSGVHEVSNGQVPGGVTAGIAIELLQQSDTTQMSEFLQAIEGAVVQVGEWTIQHMAQFYREERLVAISSMAAEPPPMPPPEMGPMGPGGAGAGGPGGGVPPMPLPGGHGVGAGPMPPVKPPPSPVLMKARAFKALTAGGQCRVQIVPGSSTPKTAAARSQQILDMAGKGMFAPDQLPMTKIVVDLMGLDRSDKLRDRIDALIKDQQASAPNPDLMDHMKTQMQMQQDRHAQKADQQHQAELEAIKIHGEIELMQAKQQHEAETLAIEHHHAIELAQVEAQLKIREMQAAGALGRNQQAGQMIGQAAAVNDDQSFGHEPHEEEKG